MAFVEVRFPEDISYGSSGGPEYATDIVVTAGGHEKRNTLWSAPRARYNVAQGVRSKAQLDALIAFFRARQGRAHGFRFKDWTDFEAVGQVIGTGNGVETVFPLVKSYVSGSVAEIRPIAKPVAGTVRVYLDSVEQMSGFAVDTVSGNVTFVTPPANSVEIQADFEFDVPVRFDTDRISAVLESYGIYSVLDIPLIELRVS